MTPDADTATELVKFLAAAFVCALALWFWAMSAASKRKETRDLIDGDEGF